jgi:hypothetical protein
MGTKPRGEMRIAHTATGVESTKEAGVRAKARVAHTGKGQRSSDTKDTMTLVLAPAEIVVVMGIGTPRYKS